MTSEIRMDRELGLPEFQNFTLEQIEMVCTVYVSTVWQENMSYCHTAVYEYSMLKLKTHKKIIGKCKNKSIFYLLMQWNSVPAFKLQICRWRLKYYICVGVWAVDVGEIEAMSFIWCSWSSVGSGIEVIRGTYGISNTIFFTWMMHWHSLF